MTRTVRIALPAGMAGGVTADGLPPGNDATPWTSATGQKIAAEAAPTGINEAGTAGDGTSAELAEDTRPAAALTGSGRWLTLRWVFLCGQGLAFTPAVLPLIQIEGNIVGTGKRGDYRVER